jgi:serine/threonine-protein kinase RsbW
MPDFVEVVGGHLARDIGLDADSLHWVNVAVRECVVNAIKHGNRYDAALQVFVDFEVRPAADCTELVIRVRDQGEGFDPEEIADPLEPENLLKASGRGIFLIRSFMDDVRVERATGGGMEVIMIKRGQPSASSRNTYRA